MMKSFNRLKGALSPTRDALTPAARGSRHKALRSPTLALVMLSLFSLAACEGTNVKESLGLARTAPDEFTVVSRPALSVPPDFTLRPPHPGEAPPHFPTADVTAHGILIGKAPTTAQDPSTLVQPTVETAVTPVITKTQQTGAEASFLKRAGADKAHEDIRGALTTDANTPADTSSAKSLLEKVTGAKKDEPVVDAKKEAERLRDNKDNGKPATEGTVPDEQVKKPSLIDRIF